MEANRYGVNSELIVAAVIDGHVTISGAGVIPRAPVAAIGIPVGLAISQEVDAVG